MKISVSIITGLVCFFITISTFGQEVLKLDKKTKKWIEKCEAAFQKGNIDSMLSVGKFYLNLKGDYGFDRKERGWYYLRQAYRKDPLYRENEKYFYPDNGTFDCSGWNPTDSTLKYFTIAADNGNVLAMYDLGVLYYRGFPYNVKPSGKECDIRNLHKALYWVERAAGYGCFDAIQDVVDLKAAIDNPAEKAIVAYNLNDYEKAIELWKIDYKYNRNPLSSYNVGVVYLNRGKALGEKIMPTATNNLNNALDAFRDAGNDGIGEASYYAAGLEWSYGEGTAAREWYTKAIEQGYKPAESALNDLKQQLSSIIASRNAPTYYPEKRSSSSGKSNSVTEEKRKTCPVCNGRGTVSDTYTSETRDWGNKTITMTDHRTTRICSRCNGKGYYTY